MAVSGLLSLMTSWWASPLYQAAQQASSDPSLSSSARALARSVTGESAAPPDDRIRHDP